MPVTPTEQEPGGDLRHAGSGPRREIGAGKGCAGMPKLAAARNVVHNGSRVQGARLVARRSPERASVSGRNLVEPLGRVAPDGQSLRRGPGRLLRCQVGAPGEATANRFAARRPGGGRPGWVPPQQDLRHPVPLIRGAVRGVSRFRQHEHPVEGPATEVAEPTAGCSVCACGYGYPEHVATSCLEGVSGWPKNPHYKVLWPEWPLPVAKPVDGATPILIYVSHHPIAPGRFARRLRTTCRIPRAP